MTYSEFPSAHLLTLLKLLLGFSGKQGLKEARLNKEIFKLAMVGGILFFFACLMKHQILGSMLATRWWQTHIFLEFSPPIWGR